MVADEFCERNILTKCKKIQLLLKITSLKQPDMFVNKY